MDSSDIIALVAIILNPVSALGAILLTARVTGRQKAQEQAAVDRAAALAGIARFASLVLDAEPEMVATGDLREYPDAAAAIEGLYGRWIVAREPLVLLRFTHPSEQVQQLAFVVQAHLELALRLTDGAISTHGDLSRAKEMYRQCQDELGALGQLLTQSDWPRLDPSARTTVAGPGGPAS